MNLQTEIFKKLVEENNSLDNNEICVMAVGALKTLDFINKRISELEDIENIDQNPSEEKLETLGALRKTINIEVSKLAKDLAVLGLPEAEKILEDKGYNSPYGEAHEL